MFKPIVKLLSLVIFLLFSQLILSQDYVELSTLYFDNPKQSHIAYLRETFQKQNKENLIVEYQNLVQELKTEDQNFDNKITDFDNKFRSANQAPENEYECKQSKFYESELHSLDKSIKALKFAVNLAKTSYNICTTNCAKTKNDYLNQLSRYNDMIEEFNQKKDSYNFYRESCSKLYNNYDQKYRTYQHDRDQMINSYTESRQNKSNKVDEIFKEIKEIILNTPMPYTEYNDNGTPARQGLLDLRTYHFVGYIKYYNKNGKINAEGELKNDLKTGQWKFYDEYGNLSEVNNYTEGKRNGQYIEYFEQSSQASIIANLKDDVLHGNFKSFYSNGKMKEEVDMVQGQKNGHYTEYYDTGIKKAEVDFENGKVVGSWINYNEQGVDEQALMIEDANNFLKQEREFTKEYIASIDNSSVSDTISAYPIRTIKKGNLELKIDFSKSSKETVNFFLVRPNHRKSIELRKSYINDVFETDGGKVSCKYLNNDGTLSRKAIYSEQTVFINDYQENGGYTQTEYQNRNKVGTIKEFDKNGKPIIGDEVDADANTFLKQKNFLLQSMFSRPSTIEISEGIWKITWENFSSDDFVKEYEALEEGKEQYTSSTYSYKIIDDTKIELTFIESNDNQNKYEKGDLFIVNLEYVNTKEKFYALFITNNKTFRPHLILINTTKRTHESTTLPLLSFVPGKLR